MAPTAKPKGTHGLSRGTRTPQRQGDTFIRFYRSILRFYHSGGHGLICPYTVCEHHLGEPALRKHIGHVDDRPSTAGSCGRGVDCQRGSATRLWVSIKEASPLSRSQQRKWRWQSIRSVARQASQARRTRDDSCVPQRARRYTNHCS